MKKFLVLLIATAFTAQIPSAVPSEVPPSIAVIDTGANSSLFKDAIATEVCVISSFKCPNGKLFMEGPGAANIEVTTNKALNHGTQMISVINAVNPQAKLIPIRIVGISPKGLPGFYSLNDVKAALDWVITNQAKFNISVVSLSQGRVIENCSLPAGMADQVAKLKALNVPLITAVGNDRNRTSVFAPACLSDSVSVGATDNPWPGVQPIAYDPKAVPYIARYSNGSTGQTDFFTNGRWFTRQLDGSKKFTTGTSNAAAALSGFWLLNRKANFDATFASILGGTSEIKNEFQVGRYVNIDSIPLGNTQ
jgi:hypothetical protein